MGDVIWDDPEAGPEASPAGPERTRVTAARRLLRSGGVTALALAALLWSVWSVPLGDSAYLGVLLVFLPFLAMAQVLLLGDVVPPRLAMYLSSGVSILALGAIALAVGWKIPGTESMGLTRAPLPWVLKVAGLLTAVAILLLYAIRGLERRFGWGETPLLQSLLPRSRRERWTFAGLSFVAGFGEEIAYRGFALSWLTLLLGSGFAAGAVTSLSFGLLHSYQGVLGVVRTGLLGAAFAASVLLTGNLWPAILSHTAVDLIAGLVLADSLTGARDGHRPGAVG